MVREIDGRRKPALLLHTPRQLQASIQHAGWIAADYQPRVAAPQQMKRLRRSRFKIRQARNPANAPEARVPAITRAPGCDTFASALRSRSTPNVSRGAGWAPETTGTAASEGRPESNNSRQQE